MDTTPEFTDEMVWERLMEAQYESLVERISQLSHLAHYTSSEVLGAIISNQEIWFSPVSTMNDIDEVRRGKRLIYQFAHETDRAGRALFVLLHNDPELMEMIRDEFQNRLWVDESQTFISCWSECTLDGEISYDDLAMWRAYGHDGKGVAIVIDPHEFMSAEYRSEIIACPVFYESEDQFAARAADCFRTFVINYLSLPEEVRENFRPLAVQAFVELCYYLAVSHKHPGFHQEREWRFVWRKSAFPDSPLEEYVQNKYFGGDGELRFCLPFSDSDQYAANRIQLNSLIKRIMIGPGTNIPEQRQAIAHLLNRHGFDAAQTLLQESGTPYRTKA